jgi:hypothetical protein
MDWIVRFYDELNNISEIYSKDMSWNDLEIDNIMELEVIIGNHANVIGGYNYYFWLLDNSYGRFRLTDDGEKINAEMWTWENASDLQYFINIVPDHVHILTGFKLLNE